MGTCLSLEAQHALNSGDTHGKMVATKQNAPRGTFFGFQRGPAKSRKNGNSKAPKLTIITTNEDGGIETTQGPLTGKTAAETPVAEDDNDLEPNDCDDADGDDTSMNAQLHVIGEESEAEESTAVQSPLNMEVDVSRESDDVSETHEEPIEDEEDEGEDLIPTPKASGGGLSLVHFFQSLRHTEELEHIIPEEAEGDAPSDEEEERLAKQEELARKQRPPSTTSSKKGTAATPPRPQDRIKMQHSRITRPNSIVNRSAPAAALVNDSSAPSSVSSHHLSEFRKLKVQVKLAQRQERKKARIAKLEDRYEDVRGYNTLWQDFEEIRGRAESAAEAPAEAPTLKRSDSFDLHNSGTWFFDFQSMDDADMSYQDFGDDDDMSQSSLSLHSTASMESQRRYFEEKRRGRLSKRRRQHSDTNLALMNQVITTKTKKPVDESVPTKALYTPNHATASTPSSILRGAQKKDDEAEDNVSAPETPASRGPVAPRLNAFSIATGQPEYHVYKRPGEEPIEHDSDTPKAKSRKSKAYSEAEEVDMNNDYQVVRRRRVNSCNDISILKDERSVAESLGIHLPPSPAKREFDYSSFSIEVVTTDQPDVRVMQIQDKSANRKENVVAGNASRCLEETSAGNTPDSFKKKLKKHQEKMDVRKLRYDEPPPKTIASMTTEDFLRYSDGHMLVNVTNNIGHEILYDDSTLPSDNEDKENESTGGYEQTANDVTEQIDILLAKYRTDNEDGAVPNDDDAVESLDSMGADTNASQVTDDDDAFAEARGEIAVNAEPS